MKHFAAFLLLLFILAAIWFGLVHGLHIPPYFLPGMQAVAQSFLDNHAVLLSSFMVSFLEAILGLFIAFNLAFLTGLICYFFPWISRGLNSVVVISQALPMLAVAPLIILWLGIGLPSKLVVIVLALFFPVFASFIEELNHVNPLFLELAHTMRATKWRLFRFVVWPAIFPHVAAGLKISVTWGILAAIVAEWMGGSAGLGFLMQNALSRLDTPLLFAALILLMGGTLLLYGGMNWLIFKISQ